MGGAVITEVYCNNKKDKVTDRFFPGVDDERHMDVGLIDDSAQFGHKEVLERELVEIGGALRRREGRRAHQKTAGCLWSRAARLPTTPALWSPEHSTLYITTTTFYVFINHYSRSFQMWVSLALVVLSIYSSWIIFDNIRSWELLKKR